jgi:hypothetical protein
MNRILQALLRKELSLFIRKVFATVSPGETFLSNWHVDAIAYQLMRVHKGQSRRLLINQPPRSLKSICVSVAYVAWLLGQDPTRHVIVVSYSSDFAAELHRQFRRVVNSAWYADLFPGTKWAKETGLELVTTQGGGRFATSVGGTLTGRGGDLIIVDDPLNANEAQSEVARKRVIEWYGGALVSRLNDKHKGAIVAVMQRLHEDDLAGHLLRHGGWDHLDMPAIALEDQIVELGHGKTHLRRIGDVLHPQRESQAALDAIKLEIGSLLFSAQYQQRPVPIEGNLIRRAWFQTYDELPKATYQTQVIQSWDVAMMTGDQNDFSVCTTWRVSRPCFSWPPRISGLTPQGYRPRPGTSPSHDPDRGCRAGHEPAAGSPRLDAKWNDAPDRRQAGRRQSGSHGGAVRQDRGGPCPLAEERLLARRVPLRAAGLPERTSRRSGRQRLAAPALVAERLDPNPDAISCALCRFKAEEFSGLKRGARAIGVSGLSTASDFKLRHRPRMRGIAWHARRETTKMSISIHAVAILQSLILISAANGAPVLFERVLGTRFARPIDGGLVLRDGHPLLGRSKTWRGLAAAILLAACASVLINLPWQAGALAAASAMAGDCLSSFVKRRFGLEPSVMTLGLDQESGHSRLGDPVLGFDD